MTTAGSFCTGYGGLDLAVEAALGPVQHAWHAEIDPDASKVAATRFPGVPNLGDLRAVDWDAVEPVDVLTAGFPCQPVSSAGRRKGVDDERWLWDDIATAISRMGTRPRMLVLENVAGLLTANRGHALARVIRGLASLGYVGRYRLLRASDIGAAHRRERWFCVARLADATGDPWRIGDRDGGTPADAGSGGRRADLTDLCPGQPDTGRGAAADSDGDALRQQPVAVAGRRRQAVAGDDRAGPGGLSLLPTPNATDAQGGPRQLPERRTSGGKDHGPRLRDVAAALLPTPTARDGAGRGEGGSDYWERRRHDLERTNGIPLGAAVNLLPTPTGRLGRTGGNADSYRAGRTSTGADLSDAAVVLLPTPTAQAAKHAGDDRGPGTIDDFNLWSVVTRPNRWGEYGAAIARWEHVTSRTAPDPTELGTKGQQRLAPAFVEWLMGLPAGWVTDLLPRNAALRVLGNGVVWQQAAAAIRELAR